MGPLLRVLIVTDHEVSLALLQSVVQASFTESLELRHESQAPGSTAGPAPDLLLLDLDAPPICQAWLQAWPEAGTLKVVASLFADSEQLFPALQRGAAGYVLKEARLEAMVEQLQKIAQGQPALSPQLARQLLDELTAPDPSPLSPQHADVLERLAKGYTLREIAQQKGLSLNRLHRLLREVLALLRNAPSSAPPKQAKQTSSLTAGG